MDELEQQARELLAAEYEKAGLDICAKIIREQPLPGAPGIRAIVAALSQQRAVPEGWRWVPVAATAEMWGAGMNCWSPDDTQGDYLEKAWEAMLAAAPSPEQEK